MKSSRLPLVLLWRLLANMIAQSIAFMPLDSTLCLIFGESDIGSSSDSERSKRRPATMVPILVLWKDDLEAMLRSLVRGLIWFLGCADTYYGGVIGIVLKTRLCSTAGRSETRPA